MEYLFGDQATELAEKLSVEKMEKVIGLTRDVGLLIEWIVGVLC